MSQGWEKRLAVLKDIVKRAKRFEVKMYLYINEPRNMPLEFFERYPELKGHVRGRYACMCTSVPEVKKYLYNSIRKLCSEVPDIGGFFTITRSENMTNCYSHTTKEDCDCPRCAKREPSEVLAEVNEIIASAAESVNKQIKTFAWTWSWNTLGDKCVEETIRKLPKNVSIMVKSEERMPVHVGGIDSFVSDYALSVIPLGECARKSWKIAHESGHTTVAKLQVNNSWEISSVPYLPVFGNVKKHMENLLSSGVDNLIMSWMLGGYPSPTIKIAFEYFFTGHDTADTMKTMFGKYTRTVKQATDIFCRAFSEFPFNIGVLYEGPQNAGPANLMYKEPTGLSPTMTCYAFDGLKVWRAIYPEDVFENQWKKLSDIWNSGLELLEPLPECNLKDIAHAAGLIWRSCYNQVRFIRERDGRHDTELMKSIASEEKEIALKMYKLMLRQPTIGFEAANHYYFSRANMLEKIISCDFICKTL